MSKELVLKAFEKVYGDSKNVSVYFAPGRVNLIGEHIDYNGGLVLPCALTIGTYAAVRKREDNSINFYSENFPNNHDFEKYPRAVIKSLELTPNQGFDVAYYGDIPNQSGLSSSASIEVVTAFFLNDLYDLNLDNITIAKLCQRAENEFVGVNCGIMDQFAIAMGKKDNAIYLNTETLDYTYVPIDLKDHKLIIANTNKKRTLADSKYNERRQECDEAAKMLGVDYLCQLDRVLPLDDEILQKRAKHVITENKRTKDATIWLKNGDLKVFGKLMNESHDSLRDDYEVTGVELDTLVDSARAQLGVLGSRMTGAGFGGCTVSIVKENAIDTFIENVGNAYKSKTGLTADFYVVEIGDGPVKLQ
ncbi:MAG: galactokinase [Oscillospiraceae bacterium]|nr:galactokinase [Candidatus Limimonas egerieequi]